MPASAANTIWKDHSILVVSPTQIETPSAVSDLTVNPETSSWKPTHAGLWNTQWYGNCMEIPEVTDWYYYRSRLRITPLPLHCHVRFCACGSNHMVQSVAKYLASPQSTADLARREILCCWTRRDGKPRVYIASETWDRSKGRQSPISPFVKAEVTAVALHCQTPGYRYRIPDQLRSTE